MNIEQIIKNQQLACDSENTISSNDFEEVIVDGKTIEKHAMQDGVRNGESIYYKDGKISQRINYKDGKIFGAVEIYKNGSLNLIMNYKNEKPNGPMYVFEKGKLSQIGFYKDEKKHGKFFVFNNEYLSKEENYKDDLLEGISIIYYPKSTNIFEIGEYFAGDKNGSWKQFDLDGNIIKEEFFD
ncbi:hypothetical protein FZC35_02615 [Candidatus Cytomitobacter indipagum]|uniref:Toxin-antitoxin system YwqK family antitoxin n=1 Tax=Candidatus Cytomitobacter indipagum TaxID=2601575 RepID=A0A5C0UGT5_9PROT|nr:hypothetical protein [Candidatus Cytomitobacter indipagum]QEK38244.1 hypothetical protein FZC35_02615 [Candidatus Cytomitobacter indipagum]